MPAGRQLSALGRLSGAVMQGLGCAPLQHARSSASAAVKVLAAAAEPAVRAVAGPPRLSLPPCSCNAAHYATEPAGLGAQPMSTTQCRASVPFF